MMFAPSRGRARIGVLVPFTNTNLEADLTLLRPEGVSYHFARLGGYDVDEVPDSEQMAGLGEAPLAEPLRLLAGVRPDVVLYGCTSATLAHGPAFDQELAERIRKETGALTVTAAGALVDALAQMSVDRIGFASPYVAELNDRAISFLEESGVRTVSRADFPVALGNYGQGELTPDEVAELARRADSDAAEAIVLSCTDMRAVEVIDRLEDELSKPLISSNQAMAFAALRSLNIEPAEAACGRLMSQNRLADRDAGALRQM